MLHLEVIIYNSCGGTYPLLRDMRMHPFGSFSVLVFKMYLATNFFGKTSCPCMYAYILSFISLVKVKNNR